MDDVNLDANSERPLFQVIGDPDSSKVKSLWFKMKCTYCSNFFQLCLPKKNLEANLMNHLGGTKHERRLEALSSIRFALSSGKKGRPNRSTTSSI